MPPRPFEEHLAAAVAAMWADAVPTIALIALWARGDVAPVYAIAGALPPDKRAGLLAWLTGQDPEPGAPRVERAAKEALRLATAPSARVAALALVPLAEQPAVAALARRLADGTGRIALALRAGDEARAQGQLPSDGAAVLRALQAVALAERGRRDEAEAALIAALAEPSLGAANERALIPAIARLGAWDRAPGVGWDAGAALWAAFVAGRTDQAGAERLVARVGFASVCAAATLGAGHPADAWREHLTGKTEAELDEWYLEGLITDEDRWGYRFAGALGGPRPYEDVAARVLAALAGAHVAARGCAAGLAAGPGGPLDEARSAERGRRQRALQAVEPEVTPSYRTLHRLLLHARRLSELGAADVVGETVEALERRWGPPRAWGRELGWVHGHVVEATAELLACARGRAREALELGPHDASSRVRARICAGLARDGHVDELRAPFTTLLAEPLDPADVRALVPAARAVDPDAEERRVGALARAVEALPATPEAARAWLNACDRASLRGSRRGLRGDPAA